MLSSTDMMLNHLREASSFLPFQISTEQYEKIGRFSEYLLEVNQTTNLTRITEPRDVAIKHFFDSLAVYQPELFPSGCMVADVGSGAGFPGIPLAILRPDLKITLVDSLRKRTQFLLDVTQRLGLDSVEIVHSRAEDFARDKRYREKFDVVLARAVASLNVLAELCLPLVRVGGVFLAMKGPRIADELAQAGRAIQLLGGGKLVSESSLLPFFDETRVIVKIFKESATPRLYPRKAGTPEKQPLK
jgi:16S rRNA (guanine527-N7)-methyltransferase